MRIVVSGTVGVGKSTTSEQLVKKLEEKGYKVHFLTEETAVSPYLVHFYSEPEKWGFLAQTDFLMERFKQWMLDENFRKEEEAKGEKVITVYDRHIIDDYIFAELNSIKQNISSIHSITYQVIYKELIEKITETDSIPDFLFLLKADLSTIVKRLKGRGRSAEMDTDEEYWRDLYDSYYLKPKFKNHFNKNTRKVVEIDTENISTEDIVENIIKELNI